MTQPSTSYVLSSLVAVCLATCLAQFSSAALAQKPVRQIALSEAQVQGFIAAHNDMKAAADKMVGDKPDAALQKELDQVARKFGFKDFDEHDVVASNIALVVMGIEPKTKLFTDPPTAVKREIALVIADKSLSEKDKKLFIDDLNKALTLAAPIAYSSNIELVRKHFDRVYPLLQ